MQYTKRIYDSVHGFIYLSLLERDLIDSYVFQRLHYIRQQGVAYLVYPGATNTRFEHSLGVMHVASQMFDQVMRKKEKPFGLSIDQTHLAYWKQVVRFAALCHDLGHLPFSHTAESIVIGKGGHEKWTLKLIESDYLRPIWLSFQAEFPEQNVIEDIIKVSLGEKRLLELMPEYQFTPWQRVLSQLITGDFFGADRIDYLLRDSRATGISYGLFDYQQLIEMLCILPSSVQEEGLTLGIEENGVESCEALLLARHFMHRRVYQYPSVKAYSFHMARFIKQFAEKKQMLSSLKEYISYTDSEILTDLRLAFSDPTHPGYEDAIALLEKDHRHLAVELSGDLERHEVEKWKEQLQIESLETNLVDDKKESANFSFPVLTRSGKIVDAKAFFSISISAYSSTWIYVSPKFGELVDVLLEKLPIEKNNAKT
jgi:uncharacterized protein